MSEDMRRQLQKMVIFLHLSQMDFPRKYALWSFLWSHWRLFMRVCAMESSVSPNSWCRYLLCCLSSLQFILWQDQGLWLVWNISLCQISATFHGWPLWQPWGRCFIRCRLRWVFSLHLVLIWKKKLPLKSLQRMLKFLIQQLQLWLD